MASINDYKNIIIYGVGEYFIRNKETILKSTRPNYICDRSLSANNIDYQEIKIIDVNDIKLLDGPLVVISIEKNWIVKEIESLFDSMGIAHIHASEVIGSPIIINFNGESLLNQYPSGKYIDEWNNRIYFDDTIPKRIFINIVGKNNEIHIEKNVSIGEKLWVRVGSNEGLTIGEGTEICEAEIMVSGSTISIGKDCLFSRRIELRGHDSHQIFSADTGKRLNPAKDIFIGNQVWISEDVILLGGAKIGTGSVVGTRCVTSSEFEDHCVIVGSPGRVIRNNIYWSRDDIEYFDRENFDECIDKSALKYI